MSEWWLQENWDDTAVEERIRVDERKKVIAKIESKFSINAEHTYFLISVEDFEKIKSKGSKLISNQRRR